MPITDEVGTLSDSLLIDTHIALWLASGDRRLGARTRDLIDECWSSGGIIYLSSVSVWEIGVLTNLGRIELSSSVTRWVELFLSRPGVEEAPLRWQAAARAYVLRGFEHRDPGDRLLVATAIDLGCPFVTYDEKILNFAGAHGERNSFSVTSL